ncbi:MAG TPA: biotin/lipoyl-containing protein [Polyangiaceae bacterium]|nr:biotin/lipoyl-containing protein [Polyangiaceae bacterium]
MRYYVTLEGSEYVVDVTPGAGSAPRVTMDGKTVDLDVLAQGESLLMHVDGKVVDLTVEGSPPELGLVAGGTRLYVRVESERMRLAQAAKRKGGGAGGDQIVKSPMPGRVLKVLVGEGDAVERGTPLVVVEAMKMENELRAAGPGKVVKVFVGAGQTVEGGAKLLQLG